MARYYFDIRDEAQNVRDEEGSEFDSLAAAMQGAVRSAAEIGQNRLRKDDTRDVVIDVRDERDQPVCTVTASIKVERHVPPPPAHP